MEQEQCERSKGLFHILNSKFKPLYYKMITSLQFCMLVRQSNENKEKWMARLITATTESNYKEMDRQLKELFVHQLNDSDKIIEVIKELTKIEENKNMTGEQVLEQTRRVEVKKAKLSILKYINETKDFGYKDKLRYSRENRPEHP